MQYFYILSLWYLQPLIWKESFYRFIMPQFSCKLLDLCLFRIGDVFILILLTTPNTKHICCCLVTKSSLTLQPHGLQYARLICPPLFLRICSDSCPLSQWCYLTISSSAALFSFCLQSFPVSIYVLMSWLFVSDGESIGASASQQACQWIFRDDFL